jgi:hypothetical protein
MYDLVDSVVRDKDDCVGVNSIDWSLARDSRSRRLQPVRGAKSWELVFSTVQYFMWSTSIPDVSTASNYKYKYILNIQLVYLGILPLNDGRRPTNHL